MPPISEAECDARHEALDQRLDRIDDTLERIDSGVNGNGKPGLRERVVRMETILGILAALLTLGVAAAGVIAAYR